MASPAPSAQSDSQSKPQEQISFRFCREWQVPLHSLSRSAPRIYVITTTLADKKPSRSSNMLYPKEDRITSKLMFACRTCQFSEEASSSCVFRNNLYNTVGETAGVTQDVGNDPTVGLPLYFPCGWAMWALEFSCGDMLEAEEDPDKNNTVPSCFSGVSHTVFELRELWWLCSLGKWLTRACLVASIQQNLSSLQPYRSGLLSKSAAKC